MNEIVETFSFNPDMLAPDKRLPGVSAFVRTRNGADFLEATIRSHAEFYDEIVAVYNQCTDETPNILARLSKEMGPRLRVFHYLPQVHPQGSECHARTPGDAPDSVVAYSNFALAQTRYKWAVKLDDDHLAIPEAVQSMVDAIRAGRADSSAIHCFSGLNLIRDAGGEFYIPAAASISGKGDIGYFRVTDTTFFDHDPRFERFSRGGLKRQFAGWFYWHLKFLKTGGGFANYNLKANPKSRYVRRRERLAAGDLWDLPDARRALKPGPLRRLRAIFDDKERLGITRDNAIAATFPQDTLVEALDETAAGWRRWLATDR